MPQSPYRLFVFVCTNQRPPQHPKGSCMSRGGMELLRALRDEVDKQGVTDIRIQNSGCLGPCEVGPTIVVYGRESDPDGIWYKNVTVSDVQEVVESHLKNKQVVDRLRYDWEPIRSSGLNISL